MTGKPHHLRSVKATDAAIEPRKPVIDRSVHTPKISPFADDRHANLSGPNKELFLSCLGFAMGVVR